MKNIRYILLSVISFFASSVIPSQTLGLDSLDYYIARQQQFDLQKEKRIQQIRDSIVANRADDRKLYQQYERLFDEYRSYVYDSAYVCVEKLIALSTALNDNEKICQSNVKLGFCYLSSGLFKEAFDILSALDVSNYSNKTKIEYYSCKSRLYYDLADYNNRYEFVKKYNETGNLILDSAITLLSEDSFRYWAASGLKSMKSNRNNDAIFAFGKMLDSKHYDMHDFAIATSSIAYILSMQGEKSKAKSYLIQAAIADIKSSTKETVALRNLAQLLYEERDVKSAVTYIRQALKDASFYSARHRQLEIGNILPIIEGERINSIERQRDTVLIFVVLISILSLSLIIALIVIRKSFRHLKAAKHKIQVTNNNLIEVNKIKNEYIGYFFNQSSEYIEKIGSLQRWVNRKVMDKQYDDLKLFPQRLNIQEEREDLYKRFDEIFLRLFPNFVEEFNKLLKPEEYITLKSGELLNTDLRIYALIRLGVNDSEKIARFLDYSVNTIYAYKNKMKGKAIYSSKEFKEKIMEIKSY